MISECSFQILGDARSVQRVGFALFAMQLPSSAASSLLSFLIFRLLRRLRLHVHALGCQMCQDLDRDARCRLLQQLETLLRALTNRRSDSAVGGRGITCTLQNTITQTHSNIHMALEFLLPN